VDYPAGLMLMIGILTALVAREQTGRGQLVTTDLFSVALHAHSWDGVELLNRERLDRKSGVGVTEQVINKAFRTRDGLLEISPVFSQNALRDISMAMGLGDLSADPRFHAESDRLAHAGELNAILAGRLLEKTTAEWIATLEPRGVLCGEIRTFEQAAQDAQAGATQMVVEMDHPRAGKLSLLGTPLRLHATPATHRTPPPDLGEHTHVVLKELGYTSEEIANLAQQGIFG